jgi:polysaccharide export outer membrane protein
MFVTASLTAGVAAQQPAANSPTEGSVATEATAPRREAAILPRDTLTIQTLDQPAFSGKFLIDLDGTFDFPYIGRVKAAGLTPREVVVELKKRLVPNYLVNPQMTIDLEQIANKKITVTGEVRAPSVYPFAGQLTLLTALTKAGSVTEDAAELALVFRAGTNTGIPVNLHDLMRGSLNDNLALEDGDTVLVPKAEKIYVSGEVKSPGAYPVRPGMTVQQAVTLAGGVTDKGKSSGIKIQRASSSAKKQEDVKVKDWTTEIARPGDTIVVPRRVM